MSDFAAFIAFAGLMAISILCVESLACVVWPAGDIFSHPGMGQGLVGGHRERTKLGAVKREPDGNGICQPDGVSCPR
jgi:hypothetical protein